MLHPNKKGIICDLTGKEYFIENKTLTYYQVVINDKNGRLIDLDIGNEALNNLLANIDKPICKMCGSITNVNNMVEINTITVYQDHNDVDNKAKFKICSECFSKLKEQVSIVVKSANEKIKESNEKKPIRTDRH